MEKDKKGDEFEFSDQVHWNWNETGQDNSEEYEKKMQAMREEHEKQMKGSFLV